MTELFSDYKRTILCHLAECFGVTPSNEEMPTALIVLRRAFQNRIDKTKAGIIMLELFGPVHVAVSFPPPSQLHESIKKMAEEVVADKSDLPPLPELDLCSDDEPPATPKTSEHPVSLPHHAKPTHKVPRK